MKWGVERRLEFIEFRLFWEGGVNRSDIIDMFGVSVPQASKDLTLYQDQAPGNAVYDKKAKRYIAGPKFSPQFLKTDPEEYLSRLQSLAGGLAGRDESWIREPPQTDFALTPRREVDSEVLKDILRAIREHGSLEIRYQSMSPERPDIIWRRVSPHAFGHDGLRWHIRAYCHLSDKFKDFLLPRILGARSPGELGKPASEDRLWNDTFDVEIGPHPAFTASQKSVVAKDYGMKNGRGVLKVRYAMLYYVLKRLGLMGDPSKQSPRTQHIVVLNPDEVDKALKIAEYRP